MSSPSWSRVAGSLAAESNLSASSSSAASKRARRRRASIALKRPTETSPRIGGHSSLGPLLQRRSEGGVQRVLCEVEVAEQADQGGEDAARVGAIDLVHFFVQLLDHALVHSIHRRPLERARNINLWEVVWNPDLELNE